MADNTASAPALTGRYPRERIAVKLLFLANGLYAGAWSLKVPELAGRLELTPFYVSLLVVCYGIGSITIMPIAGSQIALGFAGAVTLALLVVGGYQAAAGAAVVLGMF